MKCSGAYEQQRRPEGQAEHHGTRQIRFIHYAAICCLHGVQHRQRLLPDVVKVDSQLCKEAFHQ